MPNERTPLELAKEMLRHSAECICAICEDIAEYKPVAAALIERESTKQYRVEWKQKNGMFRVEVFDKKGQMERLVETLSGHPKCHDLTSMKYSERTVGPWEAINAG